MLWVHRWPLEPAALNGEICSEGFHLLAQLSVFTVLPAVKKENVDNVISYAGDQKTDFGAPLFFTFF